MLFVTIWGKVQMDEIKGKQWRITEMWKQTEFVIDTYLQNMQSSETMSGLQILVGFSFLLTCSTRIRTIPE
jgi:hypothetical protein